GAFASPASWHSAGPCWPPPCSLPVPDEMHLPTASRPRSSRSSRRRVSRSCVLTVNGRRWSARDHLQGRTTSMSVIFHITSERDWAPAQKAGEYRLSTRGVELEERGFIHCSDGHQVERIANAVYGDFAGWLVVLEIHVDRLSVEVRYENLDGGTELFPHIYGALPVTAVRSVVTLRKNSSGKWWF